MSTAADQPMKKDEPLRVALFATCVANALRPRAVEAALALLTGAGCEVTVPAQSCCGQPAFNSGFDAQARQMARAFIAAFADYDAIVAPSASCAGMVRRHYPKLFPEGDPAGARARALAAKTFELCEFLHLIEAPLPARAWNGPPVIWHDSCASLRDTKSAKAALFLLRAIEGLRLVVPEEDVRESCCGFGGLFSVKQPELSVALAERKLSALLAAAKEAGALADEWILSGPDWGCLAHLEARLAATGRRLRVMHVAEILAGMAP